MSDLQLFKFWGFHWDWRERHEFICSYIGRELI
jgi:hypothetical protein